MNLLAHLHLGATAPPGAAAGNLFADFRRGRSAHDPRAGPARPCGLSGPKQLVVLEEVGRASYTARHPGQWQAAVMDFRAPFMPVVQHRQGDDL